MKQKNVILCIFLVLPIALFISFVGTVHALPSLQLGPGSGSWSYDTSTDTWIAGTNPLNLFAYANSDGAGASGDFAWETAGASDRYAYLVVSAVPMINYDGFDVSVSNDGASLPVLTSGFGAPPIEDGNSLSPHGIFDTWFEIYEFQFDGSEGTITDTQPGQSGSGDGYSRGDRY